MNENEKKKSPAKGIVIMVVLIAVLMIGVELIFRGLENVVTPPGEDIFTAIPHANGRDSVYGMRMLDDEERELPDVEQWLEQAKESDAEDTVYWLYRQQEDDYILYLPEEDRVLTAKDLTADEKRQEDSEIVLLLKVRTPENSDDVDPEDQLMSIHTTSEKWRGIRVRVLVDGREQKVEKMVSTGPDLHSIEEVYIGRF